MDRNDNNDLKASYNLDLIISNNNSTEEIYDSKEEKIEGLLTITKSSQNKIEEKLEEIIEWCFNRK